MISSWEWINKKDINYISSLMPLKINVIGFWFNLEEIINPFITKIDCSNYIIPNNLTSDLLVIIYSSWDTESKKIINDWIKYLKNTNKVIIWIDVNNNEDIDYNIFDSYINNSKFRFIIEWISDTITKPNLIAVDWLDLINFFKNWGKFKFFAFYTKWEDKWPDVLYNFNNNIKRNYTKIFLNLYSKPSDFSFFAMDNIIENAIVDQGMYLIDIANIMTHTYNENLNDEYFVIILVNN